MFREYSGWANVEWLAVSKLSVPLHRHLQKQTFRQVPNQIVPLLISQVATWSTRFTQECSKVFRSCTQNRAPPKISNKSSARLSSPQQRNCYNSTRRTVTTSPLTSHSTKSWPRSRVFASLTALNWIKHPKLKSLKSKWSSMTTTSTFAKLRRAITQRLSSWARWSS